VTTTTTVVLQTFFERRPHPLDVDPARRRDEE
jgi:hypothetical protein